MRFLVLILACLFCATLVVAQEKRRIVACRCITPIQIDGHLDEPAWQTAEAVTEFRDLKPEPGKFSDNQSCVKVLYDDSGIYIGAELDEADIHQLGKGLSERDVLGDDNPIDWFGVVIDCYQKGINGYGFVVTASGVQADLKFVGNNDEITWDAVWESKVGYQPYGWTCEIKIPYSALRFPEQDIQQWSVQFGRRSFHRQQESWWNPVDPTVDGLLVQAGILEGIKDIKPPTRLSATPYFAVYAENFSQPNANTRSEWASSYNGGMDLKYGISDAYTMDMTLIPDFGQVQSDNQVLNLSPFEVRFDENRQFFTEGTELFGKANLFYSRRVGGRPYYFNAVYDALGQNETIREIRGDSKLINATKISGRSKGGMGLGFFNAVSPRDYAVITDTQTGEDREALLQPWSNYNVMVIDQNLKYNSSVTLINTNVWREGAARDANVTGLQFDLREKKNVYGLFGSGAYSQLVEPGRRDGYRYDLGIQRLSGNVNWNLSYNMQNDTYDNNDLGFNFNNNNQNWHAAFSYNWYKPFGPFINAGIGTNLRYSTLYKFPAEPDLQVRPNLFTSAGFEIWMNGRFKNYYQATFWVYTQPTKGYDYYEPRVPGRFFTYPAFKTFGLNVNSDTRKKLQAGFNGRYNPFFEAHKYQLGVGGYLTYRVNNHFSFGYDFNHFFMTLDRGYIARQEEDIIFGARDYRDITQLLRLNYAFNPKTSLSLRIRHNWTRVKYTHFYTLLLDGGIEERPYADNEDINFNAWTVDASFRWRFAPGSDFYFVWKNAIFGNDQNTSVSYGENLRQLFANPQSNSFSVKAIYYLDFQRL